MEIGIIVVNVVFLTTCSSISHALKKYYPKDINSFVGYRTTRSMSSKEAWLRSNEYASGVLFKFSFVVVLIDLALLAKTAFLTGAAEWVVFLILTIVQTEMKLRRSYP
ncbi:SdpI family protein [Chryseolinea sp. T2]|uniref:SdpI family protein n=1 Tax=Chryseolinea sp. T2 TaxID=3129255 RepID=UPI0030782315